MIRIVARICVLITLLLGSGVSGAETLHRENGVYPGDPEEDFSPSQAAAPPGRRNLALHRVATQSSAYDYNLTAQLVTDGIREITLPRWISVSTSTEGESPKHTREFVVDDNVVSGVDFDGPGWLGLHFGGGSEAFLIDRVELGLVRRNWLPFGPPVISPACIPSPWQPPAPEPDDDIEIEWTLATSQDGRKWLEVGSGSAPLPPPPDVPDFADGIGRIFNWLVEANPPVWTSVDLDEPLDSRRFRVQLEDLECKQWSVAEVRFYLGDQRVHVGGPHQFGSAWRVRWSGRRVARGRSGSRRRHRQRRPALAPAGGGGRGSGLERRCLLGTGRLDLWCRRRGGDRAVATGRGTPSAHRHDSAHLATRVCAERARGLRRGGTGAEPHPQPPVSGRRQPPPGGRRVAAAARVAGGRRRRDPVGSRLSGQDWIAATVPGTVLTSYYNAGALPDLNFGANELAISDSFFHSDFWYRNEFEGPSLARAARLSRSRRRQLEGRGLSSTAASWVASTGRSSAVASTSPSSCDPERPTRWPSASKSRPPRAAPSSTLWTMPGRTAAPSVPTIPRTTPPSGGTGSPPSAAATSASGTTCA